MTTPTLIDTRTPDPKNFIPGHDHDWEMVIGLEVHAQVSSKAKLFSGSWTEFGHEQNSNVSLVDAAMPGMLPVINEECVAQAVRTGLGLDARINNRSVFDRKNYFYPDLPQGYQISQLYHPIVGEGKIEVQVGPDSKGQFEEVEVGVERLHLEQDAGKSMHDQHPTMSYVDLNRSSEELDPALIEGARRRGQNPRVASGLGVIPRVVSNGRAIYSGKITMQEARMRIDDYWFPYHTALQRLLDAAHTRFGEAILIDCHSMPGFAPMGSRRPDIILGDRFGVSCWPETVARAEQAFRSQGYNVTRNYPYAGGYVTQHYGKPRAGIEALQIEINRDLYLNPVTMKKKRSYEALAENLKSIIADLIDGHIQAQLQAAE